VDAGALVNNTGVRITIEDRHYGINDQWRVCLSFEGGHAYDVEIIDYH
jgi:plasmid maintenance system killer protein